MPAKSKQQQKFFGVVRAMQKGDTPKKGDAGEVADDMKKTDVKKMASTKHKGLPKKVKKESISISRLKELVREEFQKIINEAKSVDKLKKEMVQTIEDLKKNFPLFKKAKESGDTKNYEKYRKIALDLTKKKKDLEKEMDKALGTLHADAELELSEDKLNEFNPGAMGAIASATASARANRAKYGRPESNIDTKWKDEEAIEKDLKAFATSKPDKAEDLLKALKRIFLKGKDWLEGPVKEGKLNEAPMSKQFMRDWEKDHEALKRHIKHQMNKPEARKMGLIGGPGGLEDMMKRVMASQAIPNMLGQKISAMTNNQQGFVEGKINEAKGNSMYDDVIALKRSFDIFKQQSPDLYKQLDAKFKVKNIQKTLGDMQKFMDNLS
jgi:hypothetical protein